MVIISLQWRHNGHDGVSNHRRFDGLLNRSGADQRKKWSELTDDRWIPLTKGQ